MITLGIYLFLIRFENVDYRKIEDLYKNLEKLLNTQTKELGFSDNEITYFRSSNYGENITLFIKELPSDSQDSYKTKNAKLIDLAYLIYDNFKGKAILSGSFIRNSEYLSSDAYKYARAGLDSGVPLYYNDPLKSTQLEDIFKRISIKLKEMYPQSEDGIGIENTAIYDKKRTKEAFIKANPDSYDKDAVKGIFDDTKNENK